MCFGGGNKQSKPYVSDDEKKRKEYEKKYGEKNRAEKAAADERGKAYYASLTSNENNRDFLGAA